MASFKQNIQTTGDYFTHQYGDTDVDTLASSVEQTMKATGYKIIEGGGANAVYEKGNKVLRLLFGAFVKYFKFMAQLQKTDNGDVELRITKHASGVAGGLIGVSQVKKELKRLNEVMKDI